MAILFDANTEYVNHGSGASLDNLDPYSVLVWVFPDSVAATAQKTLFRKAQMFGDRKEFQIGSGFAATGRFRVLIDYSTTDLLYESATDVITAGKWWFLGCTFDSGAGADEFVDLYAGDLATLAAEVAYGNRTNPSGSVVSDASDNACVGSTQGVDRNLNGKLAWIGIWNRKLTLQEIIAQQFRPHVTAGCVLFTHYHQASGTQADWSGNGNNGTIGGSPTTSDHAPLVQPFGRSRFKPYIVAGGGAITLVVADALHGHTADSPSLTQANVLSVQDATHGHTAESPALTQANVLAVQDALHAHTTESPALTQANVLAAADALHSHTAESPALVQANQLVAQDALHAHATDSPALTQANTIAAQDALHGHAADNVVLQFGALLEPADALHTHTADSAVLTQAHVLAVADALHAHQVDTAGLTQGYVLVVLDALHGHTADSVVFAGAVATDFSIEEVTFGPAVEFESLDAGPLVLLDVDGGAAVLLRVMALNGDDDMEWNPGNTNFIEVIARSRKDERKRITGATATATVKKGGVNVTGMVNPLPLTEIYIGPYTSRYFGAASKDAVIAHGDTLTADIVVDGGADKYATEQLTIPVVTRVTG